MEAALVSATTGALKPVIGKLATLLGDEYKRFKGVRKEIKSLTDELVYMEAFLMKMSEEEDPDVQDKAWMNEVQELSYDMEDSIDDFMQSVHEKDAKPDGFMDKIKHSLGKFRKMKTHHRIGNEIQDLKKQIMEVGERNERYKTRQAFSNNKNATVDPRALAIFEHASKLVGIDEPKREVIKLLTEEVGVAPTQKRLKVVSIVGSGGMGKTTLANQVYQELKGQFKCWAFVSVSRNPDMMNILRTILSEVSGKDYAHTEVGSIQQLICKINDTLEEKRYIMVVDDIWDVKTWDVIRHAFPMTNCGSILITTTRVIDVAYSCRSSIGGHMYNIRPLNMVHSKQLFHRRLFNSEEDCPSSLEKVSDQILMKCGGLPLAIIAISGLLANTGKSEQQWNQVKDSIGRALERNPSVEGMIKILSLSYFDLPPHLKGCLLYVSIFPEDSFIQRHMLIWRWIAEGLIHKEGRYTAFEIGKRCFNELVNRSLIQLVQFYDNGKVCGCRVHDTILDFIISKSIEENFVTFVGVPGLTMRTRSKIRRLSLQVEGEGISVVPTGLVLSHVRSLNVFGVRVEIPSMMEFRHLRAMDFEECIQLETHHLANIGRLFQLRYLNICSTHVKELPEEIGHLRCLEILDISGMSLCDLPAGIVNLRKLAHLLVHHSVKFPDGIANLQALETFKWVRASVQSYNFLQELGQLKNLRKLHFSQSHVAQEHKEVIASSLHNLCTQNLRSLTLRFAGDSILMNTWCTTPPLNLQKLFIHSLSFQKVPNWVRSLVNLQKLYLELERIQQEDMCMLGALPALLTLELIETKDQSHCEDRKLTISRETGFRCLTLFNYTQQYRMLDLMFTARCMPKLEILEVWLHDVENESLSSAGAFCFGIKNLSSLVTFRFQLDCPAATESTVHAVKASLEREVGKHPNSRLNLIFCDIHGCYT